MPISCHARIMPRQPLQKLCQNVLCKNRANLSMVVDAKNPWHQYDFTTTPDSSQPQKNIFIFLDFALML